MLQQRSTEGESDLKLAGMAESQMEKRGLLVRETQRWFLLVWSSKLF